MGLLRKIAKYIFILLSPAVIMLFFNAADNKHTHVLANGQIIVHAHPYKTGNEEHAPVKNHKHSHNLLILINIISNAHSSVAEDFLINFELFAYFIDNYNFPQIIFFVSEIIFSENNRAPPVYFQK